MSPEQRPSTAPTRVIVSFSHALVGGAAGVRSRGTQTPAASPPLPHHCSMLERGKARRRSGVRAIPGRTKDEHERGKLPALSVCVSDEP
ncbi:hypothetical protein E2C01_030863 [Portunus trituberculatus]|uniref:Uncharacterized protein n=1 Tax=Portunus trituberculatus TaxID=210409 RepID=A0A5B7EW17_PORTR|nr:hypothetical protein [Portunus trituberculatus]